MYSFAAQQPNMMGPPLSAGHSQLAHAGGWPHPHAQHHRIQSHRLAIGHPSAMPYGHQQALMHQQTLHGHEYDLSSLPSHVKQGSPNERLYAKHVQPTPYMPMQCSPSGPQWQGQLAGHVSHSEPAHQQHFHFPSPHHLQYDQGGAAMSQPIFDDQTVAYINGHRSHPALSRMQSGSRMRMAEQHAEDFDIEQEINIKIKSRSKHAGKMQGKGQDQTIFGHHYAQENQ